MPLHDFIDDLSPAIDTMETKNVLAFLTDDCVLQPGNQDIVRGTEAITEVFDSLYASIHAIKHTIDDKFAVEDTAVYRGTVSYRRMDDSDLTVPFCDVFKVRDGKIAKYFIYIDWHELFSVKL